MLVEKSVKKESWLHFCVSSVGGFMGAYAIINHCDLLASSQTANMIHIVHNLFESEHPLLIYMILAAVVYGCGNVAYVLLKKFIKSDTRIISLFLTATAFVLVSVLNFVENPYLAMLPLFFITPIQWNAFAGDAGYGSSTIFSTNNYRQAITALTSYLIDGDIKMKRKAQFFGMTLLFFHIGVVLASVTAIFWARESIWWGFLPLAVSAVCCMWYKDSKIFSTGKKYGKKFIKSLKAAS